MNTGDYFLPKGQGWEYRVLNKVMHRTNSEEYSIDVLVKKV
jgi:hypothetical protein